MLTTTAFKAYDIRGRVPSEINEQLAYTLGRVFVDKYAAQTVVVGRDIRESSASLCTALTKGLRAAGAKVLDIGLCGTEMVYFATTHLQACGGIMVTASHNPQDYNGMKLVRAGAVPISGDTGLQDLAKLVVEFQEDGEDKQGEYATVDIMPAYRAKILSFVDTQALKPLKIVVNAGNGCAGPVFDQIAATLPFEVVRINHQPDGSFPNGIPNPMLVENQGVTARAVVEHQADLGIAWDGDFDRCFLFAADGEFIEGYYLVGFLAEVFLQRQPGAKIMYDPRLTWNTLEIVEKLQGQPVISKGGHAFMKETMRREEVLYGGEMSAHHYFKDFTYADSGMIPWLLVLEYMSQTGRSLKSLVAERMAKFPCSGEINRRVADASTVLAELQAKYDPDKQGLYIDGIAVDFPKWRFNVRVSNTEPVIRLNLETRGDRQLLAEKTAEVLALIGGDEA
ncbi:phosphomannomutase/phosphoglucomutase [Succinispira mobilis]|uniref:phosphomannomutase/phosphoglucomutase n=1 Tax=Succinispira mobilis TaxID=78120 RepID=UPI00035D41F8|nr:phosphomannomutase/phosphoglucomutase [Succinispira mobilis]